MDNGKGKAVIESTSMSTIEEVVGLSISSRGWGGGGGGEDVASSSSRGGGGVAASSSIASSSSNYWERGPQFWTSEELDLHLTRVRQDLEDVNNNAEGGGDLFWTRDLDRHCFGDVSTAVMQANVNLEDFSQVELGRTATYVGIYDGHGGGYQAAAYVRRNMTRHLMECIRDTSTMSIDNLREAFLRTEASWLDEVDAQFVEDPYIAGYGTCCLVGVFWRRTLYLANAGDSRAIIGRVAPEDNAKIDAHPLTRDDNVNDSVVRAEVQALHPDETDFVVEDAEVEGLYRIKGRIQVSKSIGDAYLKRARFNLNHVDPKFKLNAPVSDDNPALSADPSTYTIPIEPQDRFVIFASDGLWDMMTNQEAADIVHQNPKEGIAKRLVTEGLTMVATKLGGTSHEDFLQIRRDDGERRDFHDDISVVVIFFDDLEADVQEVFPRHSIVQGSVRSEGESNFTALDDLALSHINWRTVCIRNLPYDTRLQTIYPHLRRCGQLRCVMFGSHGFWCEVEYFYPEHANAFIHYYRNSLILEGKLACITFLLERRYRLGFCLIDNLRIREEVPFTLSVSNLDAQSSVTTVREFFTSRGLRLRNQPIMYVRHNGELYSHVSFVSVQESEIALTFDGMLHLGRPIRLARCVEPELEIRQSDLEPDV